MKLNPTDRNELEWKLLNEFKEKVSDLHQDDVTCLRFLIAREFNLDMAEDMLRKSIAWRANVGIENYWNWTWKKMAPEVPKEDFEFEVTGISHNGGPVLWVPVGRYNARYWIDNGKQEELQRFAYQILETGLQRMKELNNKQVVLILGSETLNYSKVSHLATMKVLYTTFQALEVNYPETIQSIIVVNAPWMFSIGYNFVKPILSPATVAKIEIHGTDRDECLAALRKQIPDSAIPPDYL